MSLNVGELLLTNFEVKMEKVYKGIIFGALFLATGFIVANTTCTSTTPPNCGCRGTCNCTPKCLCAGTEKVKEKDCGKKCCSK